MGKVNKSSIKVSVCISVYNGEKYIIRCLNSVCSQTLDEIEIVIVNDGSSDNSLDIINRFVKEHPEKRFEVISQENRGLCKGRSRSVKHAHGEYITFLDQDDFVEQSTYEKMFNCAEKNNVDVVEIASRCGKNTMHSPFYGIQKAHDVLKHYFRDGGVSTVLWLRMYRRLLFDEQVFPDIYTNNEDIFAFPCILHSARNIYFINEPLHIRADDNDYSYMRSLDSYLKKTSKPYESFKIRLLSFNHFQEYVGKNSMLEYENEFNHFKARYSFAFLMSTFYKVSLSEKTEVLMNVLLIDSHNELKKYLCCWLPSKQSLLLKILGIRISYGLYYLIHKVKR